WHDLPREGRLLLSTVVVDALGTGFVLPFAVVYLHEVRGLPLETVGVVLAVPAVVALALLGPIGTIIDRFGPRRVQALAMLVQLVGSVLLAFVHDAPQASVAMGLIGVGHAAFWPASQSLVATVIPSEIRQRYYGMNFTLLNAGIGIGGLTSGLVVSESRPWTFTAIYLLDAATFLAPLAVLLGPLRHVGNAVHREPSSDAPASVAPATYRAVLRDPVFRSVLAVTFFSAFVGYAQFEAGWTAYARTVAEASTRLIGLAFAVNAATIVLLQLVVIQRIEGHRRTRVLMLMSGVWAASWSLMGLAGLVPASLSGAVLLTASMGVFALGETLLSPVAPAMTNDLAPDHLRGRYNAVGAAVFQMAAVLGPVVAGSLLGRRLPAVFVGVLLAGCAAMVLVLLRLERVIPAQANGLAAVAADREADRERVTTG
ncbi:MAG TPA: MFS transporter, partial [Actinomycetales bacterium]|nr:MFS transporter [Actinomycetales bacterium]